MANVNLGIDGVYTSFSGADAIVSFAGTPIAEIQAVTVNCQREKGPIYVMGSANPMSFSRGKRGIAGNLVFVQFDRNALISTMEQVAKQSGTIPQYTAAGNLVTNTSSVATPVTTAGVYTGLPLNSTYNSLSTVVQFNNANVAQANTANGGFIQLHGSQINEFWTYDDQIPPFEVDITLANEYGSAAYFTIYGVEILNFGMGLSIDDINMENACTFVATRLERVRPGFKLAGQADTSTPSAQSFTAPNALI